VPLVLATTTPGEPEIFASLQGEGPSQGKPCAFIRLSRCNLACHWCDTAYTWHFEGDDRPHRSGVTYERQANQLTLSEEDAAMHIAALAMPRLVITGGEPLLQGAALARMVGMLPPMAIEIETNGTAEPPAALDIHVDQYTVSPKLAHSGNPTERAVFKFVIAEPSDLEEVLTLARRYGILPHRIWLMAEGTDVETLGQREQWLAQICLEHRLTLSKRLHIQLYGDSRGT
jgi:7-carboxy-7-deazaguanine synthase